MFPELSMTWYGNPVTFGFCMGVGYSYCDQTLLVGMPAAGWNTCTSPLALCANVVLAPCTASGVASSPTANGLSDNVCPPFGAGADARLVASAFSRSERHL